MKITLLLLCATVASFSGCTMTTSSAPRPADGIYRGRYVKRFEVSSFQPCGTSEQWWVSGRVVPLIAAVTSSRGFVRGTAYVELRGRVSPRGSYGLLGGYQREFIVTPRPNHAMERTAGSRTI